MSGQSGRAGNRGEDDDSAAPRTWTVDARYRFGPVMEAASRLQVTLDTGVDPASWRWRAIDPGSAVVASCSDVLAWLRAWPPPDGAERADAELRAAIGVFRNAAFVYRELVKANASREDALTETCRSMLLRGGEHARAFLTCS